MHKLFYSVFILLVISSCSNNNIVDKSITNINDRLNKYLELELKDNQFPGIQYVVFNKDNILYEYYGGYAKVMATCSGMWSLDTIDE